MGCIIIVRKYILLFIITIIPNFLFSCPYCAGQIGENYIQEIILPIAGLLLSPFIIIGTVVYFIYYNRNKI